MMLTPQAHRSRTPKESRRIPTIPAGRFDGRLGNVSAVDTRPRRSESGVLTAQPDASVTGPPPPLPARCLHRVPVVMVRRRPRPESARVGLLHEGRDPLTKGCAYCTKAPPTPSTPNPRPVAPHPSCSSPGRCQQPPQRPGQPRSDRPKQQLSHPADPPPTGVLRCHDIRNSQKS